MQESSSSAPPVVPMVSSSATGKVGPSVRKLLIESGLDISQMQGTGPRGMVLKGDVLAAMKSGMKPQAKKAGAPAPTASKKGAPGKSLEATGSPLSYEDIPNTQIRKVFSALHLAYQTDFQTYTWILIKFGKVYSSLVARHRFSY